MTKPLRILSLGAGVQSTTVLRMSIAGELPPLDHAIFVDTGWEPSAVYGHLVTLQGECARARLPLHIVRAGDIRSDALDPEHRYASIPLFVRNPDGSRGMGRRQCTSEYKLAPILRKQRELAGLKPRQRSSEILVESIQGISYDETQRMRDPHFPWIVNGYPLVDLKMTRQDCLRWNDQHGFPRPPRSACLGCPFHSDAEWLHIRETDPDGWADAVDFDTRIRDGVPALRVPSHGQNFLHGSLRPLAEASLRPEDDGQLPFDFECEGLCGV